MSRAQPASRCPRGRCPPENHPGHLNRRGTENVRTVVTITAQHGDLTADASRPSATVAAFSTLHSSARPGKPRPRDSGPLASIRMYVLVSLTNVGKLPPELETLRMKFYMQVVRAPGNEEGLCKISQIRRY